MNFKVIACPIRSKEVFVSRLAKIHSSSSQTRQQAPMAPCGRLCYQLIEMYIFPSFFMYHFYHHISLSLLDAIFHMSKDESHDADTQAFFKEIDDDNKRDYAKCSASQTFDAVWNCYTLGAQALNYYRYGEKKDCTQKWEDFKFCLTTKTKSNEIADRMIREREQEKAMAKKRSRSSEEVWELRQ